MTTALVQLPARELTLDDVAELAGRDPDHRYELQDGNLVVMPPPDDEHAELVSMIIFWLFGGGHAGRVLANPGIRAGASGRSPDIAVRRSPRTGRTVWLEPVEVVLAVEIVSPGSAAVDRRLKPIEYARAGIPNFWRVERDGPPTVHMFRLGTGVEGEPTYLLRDTLLLQDLLDGPVPPLAGEV